MPPLLPPCLAFERFVADKLDALVGFRLRLVEAGETYTAQWTVHGMLERSDIANLLTAELDRGKAEAIALALPEKADWLLIAERVGRRFA